MFSGALSPKMTLGVSQCQPFICNLKIPELRKRHNFAWHAICLR